MKTTDSKNRLAETPNFHDFTIFSVFVVRPGTVLTPQAGSEIHRYKIASLRKHTSSLRESNWYGQNSSCHTLGNAETKLSQREKANTPDVAEEAQWASMSARALSRWAEENEE